MICKENYTWHGTITDQFMLKHIAVSYCWDSHTHAYSKDQYLYDPMRVLYIPFHDMLNDHEMLLHCNYMYLIMWLYYCVYFIVECKLMSINWWAWIILTKYGIYKHLVTLVTWSTCQCCDVTWYEGVDKLLINQNIFDSCDIKSPCDIHYVAVRGGGR